MTFSGLKKSLWIITSFIVAFMLSLVPYSSEVVVIRPNWVLLVLSYWIVALPNGLNLGIAWFLGLLTDVLCNSLLGEHALAMVVVAYVLMRMRQQVRMAPLWQQVAMIFIIVLIYQMIIYCIQAVVYQVPQWGMTVGVALTSMLIGFVGMLFRMPIE